MSEYMKGNLGKNSLTKRERTDKRRAISHKKRKLIERVFGWSKADRQLAAGEAARAEAGGLVLPADHGRLQPDADEQADPASHHGHLSQKCVWNPAKPQQRVAKLNRNAPNILGRN